MIHINCLDITQISEDDYLKLYTDASQARKEKADRCRLQEDAKRCILSDILLRYSLFEFCGHRGDVVTECTQNGKPYVKNVDGFFYNISHSGKWVVVAYGSSEVGTDVERLRENTKLEMITRRFFTEEEKEYIFTLPDSRERLKRFTKLWTMKESYVKYLGIGLAKGLETFSVDGASETIKDSSGRLKEDIKLKSWLLEEEYYLSVCSRQDEIMRKTVTVQLLLLNNE